MGYAKKLSSHDAVIGKKVFQQNIVTYFPSYRYEQPGYLNDPYKMSLQFNTKDRFGGRLPNPIEVVSGLEQLSSWIMDVVLDVRGGNLNHFGQDTDSILWNNLCEIISKTLISKFKGQLRFGIGLRNNGRSRIRIMDKVSNASVYPSLFHMSAGEAAIFTLFGELLRQGDNINPNISLSDISGVVLIDEADKHLHIRLQKEIFPILVKMFPKVQFIITSHSPWTCFVKVERGLYI